MWLVGVRAWCWCSSAALFHIYITSLKSQEHHYSIMTKTPTQPTGTLQIFYSHESCFDLRAVRFFMYPHFFQNTQTTQLHSYGKRMQRGLQDLVKWKERVESEIMRERRNVYHDVLDRKSTRLNSSH